MREGVGEGGRQEEWEESELGEEKVEEFEEDITEEKTRT